MLFWIVAFIISVIRITNNKINFRDTYCTGIQLSDNTWSLRVSVDVCFFKCTTPVSKNILPNIRFSMNKIITMFEENSTTSKLPDVFNEVWVYTQYRDISLTGFLFRSEYILFHGNKDIYYDYVYYTSTDKAKYLRNYKGEIRIILYNSLKIVIPQS